MDILIPHVGIHRNDTIFSLQFSVSVKDFTIRSIKPRGERLVSTSKILKICSRLDSTSWFIKVMIENEFSGLILKHEHLQYNVLIVYKFRRIENGKYILVAEGVKEKTYPDIFLRMGWRLNRDQDMLKGCGKIIGCNCLHVTETSIIFQFKQHSGRLKCHSQPSQNKRQELSEHFEKVVLYRSHTSAQTLEMSTRISCRLVELLMLTSCIEPIFLLGFIQRVLWDVIDPANPCNGLASDFLLDRRSYQSMVKISCCNSPEMTLPLFL
ncbi:Uncharacterized protein Fot_09866 [Forsythia ovata]|uniref:Uncharacterized protein n=1 Tax=Forsythia ovata TaxID=205694 RepID=A0ABD1WF74_9LAMI